MGNLRLLLVTLVLLILVSFVGYRLLYSPKPPKIPNLQLNSSGVEVTGVLRKYLLMKDEGEKLGLKRNGFLVNTFIVGNKINGYYLESQTDYEDLVGKCIKTSGSVKKGWESLDKSEYNGTFTYGYSVLEPNKNPQVLDFSKCSSYPATPVGEKDESVKRVLSGVLVHTDRFAPDMSYDYLLILDKPNVEPLNASGINNFKLEQYDVSPLDNNTWKNFEENINKKVTVTGYMRWGYAESTYLETHEIKEDKENKPITKLQAENLVKNLSEVRLYLIDGPNRIVETTGPNDYQWLVHVYEIVDDHTTTFNWYEVSQKTGKITKTFDFK